MNIDLFPAGNPVKPFPGKKGDIIHFIKRNEQELILSCSRAKDEVKTERETYSLDFLQRWYNFEFIKVIKKNGRHSRRFDKR